MESGEGKVTQSENLPDTEPDQFPVEPRYHPVNKIARKIYDFLASSKLAMFLLIVILACCVVGVTLFRGVRAGEIIFSTLWFNGLLVLLVVNVACCFFGRVWHRKLILISFGMILFHLSFVAVFTGIIYNSLFYFRGTIRLTEGETLPNGDPQSYDSIDKGRFFSFLKLKGETTLVKMHTGYKIDGADKKVAYDVSIGEGTSIAKGIIYITKHLDNKGVKYFRDKEGYSLLTLINDKQGKTLFGAHIPLQSIEQQKGRYIYTSGTKNSPGSFPFPAGQAAPLISLQVGYTPSKLMERGGDIYYQVWKLKADGTPEEKQSRAGKAAVDTTFDAGEYDLSVKEVRYWAAMAVRYEPGQPIVLASLWLGLAGIVITFFGRVWIKKNQATLSSPSYTKSS